MDEPKEHIDVLDCSGKRTGQAVLRAHAHQQGIWHGAFHCLIIHRKHGHDFALFQLRSREKMIAPGLFDVSVGGHYRTGEDAGTAGPREVWEELGISAEFSEFQPLGRRTFVYCSDRAVREYEFQDVYLLEREIHPHRLTLQPEEVDGVLDLSIDSGIALFSGASPSADGMFYSPGRTGEVRSVAIRDFVACPDDYYLKLLLLARRYCSGERELLRI